jgi:hypothetical protein
MNYSTYVDVDVDVDEFLDNCSDYDITDIIEWLTDEGHLEKGTVLRNANDTIWNDEIRKLYDATHLLTSEEEEVILKITKKLI